MPFRTSMDAMIVVKGERSSCDTLLANLASASILCSKVLAIWLNVDASISRSGSFPTSRRAERSPTAIARAVCPTSSTGNKTLLDDHIPKAIPKINTPPLTSIKMFARESRVSSMSSRGVASK